MGRVEDVQFVLYGNMVLAFVSYTLVFFDDLGIGLVFWVFRNKQIWRLKPKYQRRLELFQFFLIMIVLFTTFLVALENLHYNILFWIIVVFILFAIFGGGLIQPFVWLYNTFIQRLLTQIKRFYYRRMSRSVSKLYHYGGDPKDLFLRLLKIGSLQQILELWNQHNALFDEDPKFYLKVRKVLLAKLMKEDMSYQLPAMELLLDWMIKINTLSISLLKVSPDEFVKLNQEMLDAFIDNLPRYEGKIYMKLSAESLSSLTRSTSVEELLFRLIDSFGKYIKTSNAKRVDDVLSFWEAQAKKQLSVFSKLINKCKPYDLEELAEFQRKANKLTEADPVYFDFVSIYGINKKISALYKKTKAKVEFIEKIKRGNVSVISCKYHDGFRVVDASGLVRSYLYEFLEFLEPLKVLKRNIEEVPIKKEIYFNGEFIEEFLNFLFNAFVESRDDDSIDTLIRTLNKSLKYLMGLSYHSLSKFVEDIMNKWLSAEKTQKYALMIPAVLQILSDHQIVKDYKDELKLKGRKN
ncbi:MAG: hypothetical protein GXP45_05955 [bacterium]|nr:hypothetical protein [bacterium]